MCQAGETLPLPACLRSREKKSLLRSWTGKPEPRAGFQSSPVQHQGMPDKMIIPGSAGCNVQPEVAAGDRCWRQGTRLRLHLPGGRRNPLQHLLLQHLTELGPLRETGSSSKNHLEQEELYPGEAFPAISLSDSTSECLCLFFCQQNPGYLYKPTSLCCER